MNTLVYVFILVIESDSSAPVISGCPESAQYMIPSGTTSRVVTWIEPTATDNTGGQPTVIRSHEPGSNFPIGTTQVIYTFRDAVGNEATCSFEIMGNFFGH